MGQTSAKTAYYIDFDLLRDKINQEISVRASSMFQLHKDTGIATSTLSNYLSLDSANRQTSLSADTFATLMKWGNFAWGEVVKRRKGIGTRHADTKDQAELRAIVDLLEKAGVKLEAGESVSQMLARVLGK